MIYNLQDIEQKASFKLKTQMLISKGATVDLTEKKGSRTLKQNSAIHLYCTMIAEILNDYGLTFSYNGVSSNKVLEIPYTMILVKETMWKPIQNALFGKKSTTELTTKEVSEIAMPLERFIAENLGVDLPFPSVENK